MRDGWHKNGAISLSRLHKRPKDSWRTVQRWDNKHIDLVRLVSMRRSTRRGSATKRGRRQATDVQYKSTTSYDEGCVAQTTKNADKAKTMQRKGEVVEVPGLSIGVNNFRFLHYTRYKWSRRHNKATRALTQPHTQTPRVKSAGRLANKCNTHQCTFTYLCMWCS